MNETVVIATYNRAKILRETLERLRALPEQPPIVVVDNGSTDRTFDVVRRFGPGVTYVRLDRNLGAAGRTAGVLVAETPLVAFCDDDCFWAPGALSRARKYFAADERLAVVNARVFVRGTTRLDPACAAMALSERAHDDGRPIAYFMAGASVIRRDAYLQTGGYHERYHIGAEESLLSLDLAALGWRMLYCDDVVLYHYPSPIGRVQEERRRLSLRNQLWTTWLRRSLRQALVTTGSYVARAGRDRTVRGALLEAIEGLPWVLRERRPIPPELERRLSRLQPVID